MSIITERGAPGSASRRYKSGFTIPEILVSLCILMLLLHSVWQWTVLTERTNQRIQQNQQAVWLAQEALAGSVVHQPTGWTVQLEQEDCGAVLTAQQITVCCGEQRWQFYYAGLREGAQIQSWAE